MRWRKLSLVVVVSLLVVAAVPALASTHGKLAALAPASAHGRSASKSAHAHAYLDPYSGHHAFSDDSKPIVVTVDGLPSDGRTCVWRFAGSYSLSVGLEAKGTPAHKPYAKASVYANGREVDSVSVSGYGRASDGKSGTFSLSGTCPCSGSLSVSIRARAEVGNLVVSDWADASASISGTLTVVWPDVVTVTASEGGSVSPSGRLEVWGDYLSVRATPDPGYEFDHWEVSGGVSIVDSSANGRFRVTGDGAVKAVFRPAGPPQPNRYRLAISVRPPGAGTTSPSPGTYEYCAGASVTVSASAYGGYVFDHWELDGASAGSSASITVTMDRDHSLVAVFKSSSGDGGDGGGGQQPPGGNETYTYYVDHYKRVVEKERTYYVSSWGSSTIYWPLSGEKVEGKLAPSEYFGVRVTVHVAHRDTVVNTYEVFLYTETKTTSDPSEAGKHYKVIDYTETRIVRVNPASYSIDVSVPSTWAWYVNTSGGSPVPEDGNVTLSARDSKSSDGAYTYDLGRWAVKRGVIPVGGYGDLPYTVTLNGQAREFHARVSAIKAELDACYYEWGVNATVHFLWCDDGSPVLGRRYLSAVLEYGGFRKLSTVSSGDGEAHMRLEYAELQLDTIRANMSLVPLIERGEPVPQSPATTVAYQDIALVVYENGETRLRVRVIRWGTMEPLPGAVVVAWVEGTDRREVAVADSRGFATVNKAVLLQGLAEYELWAMAYPCETHNEILNPERYAKILVDKQPP